MNRYAARYGLIARPPCKALTPFVSHYWLSFNNSDSAHTILPDGCVDIVLEVTETDRRGWVYGTTTRPTDTACSPDSHYIGVRFRPGQSRHFIGAAARELTDCREDWHGLVRFSVDSISTSIATDALCLDLDRRLVALLSKSPPELHYIDRIVRHIETARGDVRMREVAAAFGKSPRQLERLFLETVGVPFKFFSMITRFNRTAHLIALQPQRALAEVAIEAGYADQSHMTRDFTRLAGISPGKLARDNVAFLQDRSSV